MFQGEVKFLTGGDELWLRVRELSFGGQNGWEPHTNGTVRMKEDVLKLHFHLAGYICEVFILFGSIFQQKYERSDTMSNNKNEKKKIMSDTDSSISHKSRPHQISQVL